MIAVVTGEDLAAICKPWQTQLALVPSHKSPPQHPLARDEACWQGEAVVAVVAEREQRPRTHWTGRDRAGPNCRRSQAPKPRPRPARPSSTARCPATLDSSIPLRRAIPTAAFRDAAVIVEHDFTFGRQTGVTLEPRTIVAEFDPRLQQLTVHHSHQVPSQMREIFAAQLGLPLANVRVITPDVGGAFGMKLSAYPDEMAVAAIAVLLGRPVKFCADRLEVLCQRQSRA